MGRHRHAVNVRVDGIAVVLGPLLSDSRILAAALLDVGSGMVLDAWSAVDPSPGDPVVEEPGTDPGVPDGAGTAPDLELIGAQHAEIVRCALALLRTWPSSDGSEGDTCEVVRGPDPGCTHLLRIVPDPHGDRLALAVVIDGPPRVLERVRKRLRSVSVDALTAGPSTIRRPMFGGWSFSMAAPAMPSRADRSPGLLPVGAGIAVADRSPDDPAPSDVPGLATTATAAAVDGGPVPAEADPVGPAAEPVRPPADGGPRRPDLGRDVGPPSRPVPAPTRPGDGPRGVRPAGPAVVTPRRPSPPAALPARTPSQQPRP